MRLLLLPFSYIYLLITFVKNKLYDKGILKSRSFSTPIISIGNITTGGTGKTPLTVHIAKYYLQKGLKVGILSRGYGRNSTYQLLVCDGKEILHPVDMTGDELYMISEELLSEGGSFWVVADNDRVKGCEYLISNFNPDVIILDDAFQNRKVQRDLDIVLVDSENFNKVSNKLLLPAGELRESKAGIKRASLFIQNNKSGDDGISDSLKEYGKPVISMTYKMKGIFDKENQAVESLPKKIVALSGVASPDSFLNILKRLDFTIADSFSFPDHYNYIFKDIRNIKERCEDGFPIVTTHKDFVKLKEFENFIDEFRVYYLKIGLNFENNNDILVNMLNETVKNK